MSMSTFSTLEEFLVIILIFLGGIVLGWGLNKQFGYCEGDENA